MAKRKESTFERLRNGKLLNRQQKREIANRLNSAEPGFEIMNPHSAGIDIGNESHYVAAPPGRDEPPVREFGSWTADLERMAQWLKGCGIKTVMMQSTGVYWIAVYDVLQAHGFEVHLVDARGTKNLPGRKSDVQECQWLLKLHTYGLLRSCFLPPEPIRRLRTVWRLRDQHVKEAGRAIQHMQSLRGNWKEDALFELQQAIEAYDFYGQQIAKCDGQLQRYLAALPRREPVPELPATEGPTAPGKGQPRGPRGKRPQRKGNEPAFDVESEQRRILGVDATTLDGINVMTVQTVLAEVGSDLTAWKTERHWSSWLNLAPQRDVSGGRVIRHAREHRTNRVGNAFRMAAQSLIRSQSYLGARFRYLRAKLGGIKAVKAMARVLACLFYRLLTQGQTWVDRGAAEFERRRQEREFTTLQRKAREFGMKLVPAA